MQIEVEWHFVYESVEAKSIDLLGIDPIPALKFYDENKESEIRKCPAHIDALKNTYVICSPIDYDVGIHRETNQIIVTTPDTLPQNMIHGRFNQAVKSPFSLATFSYGAMLFESHKENVWVEQIEPFLEWEKKNPIRVTTGKFNIKRWCRPVDFTFEYKDKIVNLKIKRGDPLFYLRFHGENPADIITLKRIEQTHEKLNEWRSNTELKKFYQNTSLDFLYGLYDKFKDWKK